MKKTNRIMSMLLAVIMVVCMLPVSVFAANYDVFTDTDSGLNFMIQSEDDCEVSVTEGNYTKSHYEIPSSVVYNGKTYTVVFIGEIAFSGCTAIDSIVIPSSVTHMGGPNVFRDCNGLDIKVMVQGDKLDLSSYEGISSVSYQYDAPTNVTCTFDGTAKWQGLETTDVCYKLTLVRTGQIQPVAEAYVESNAEGVDYTYQFSGVTFDGSATYYLNVQAVKPEGSENGISNSTVAQATVTAYVEECTCIDRCTTADLATSNCPVCIAADSPTECMGTPELMENGSPWRLSDTEAEIGFYGSVNPNVVWKYYYLLTDDSSAQPTASEILAGGTSGVYEDPHTLVLKDLTDGEKYIHIVLRQEEQDRTTNILRLTIPAFVKLTLTPSADGGDYDAATNTLTIEGGGTVNFTLNMPGYVHCDSDDTIEATPLGDDPENATEWTVTLPATPNVYTFYYGLGGQTAECTVVVTEAHEHNYATTWSKDASGHWHECECGDKKDFASHTSSGTATVEKAEVCTICGYEIAPAKTTYTLTINYEVVGSGGTIIGGDIAGKTIEFAPGTVVDLSNYWPDPLIDTVDGTKYYFAGFTKKDSIAIIASVTVNGDIELEAVWTTEEQITVTFYTQGGDLFGGTHKSRVNKGKSFETLNGYHVPTRDGYTFLGWSVWPEGPADRPDRIIKNDCTLYAIWAEGIVITGYEDAVLVDKNGTIEKVEDGYTAIFNDSKVDMNNSAWQSLINQLQDGEQLKIATEKIDVTELADDEVLFDSGVLTGSVIFTEQELLDLKVIEEDNDEITWNELKYLYHYMTITDMKSLGWFIEDFLYNTDPQVLVWLAEMIERDTIKPLNMQELMDMADLTDEQWELLADEDLNDPPIGHLRQAGLTVEQMRRLYGEVEILIEGLNDNDKLSKCNELLDWLDDAIVAKEWEADKSQTQPTWAYTAKETVIGAVNINFDAVKVNATTNAVTEVRPITASGELAYTIAVNPGFDLAKGTVRAYKVGDDGSLSLRKVIVNADGTVTIQSDSNSTYIVTYEPAKADVDDPPTTPETPDSPQTGDNSHMWLWFGLMLASGFVLAGTWIYSRKRRTN